MSEALILEIFANFEEEFSKFKQGGASNRISEYFKQVNLGTPVHYTTKNQKCEFIGFVENRMIHGKVIVRYGPNNFYIGDYNNNKRHGNGYHHFANRIVYKGKYDNDMKVGGIVFEPELKKIIYEGGWFGDLYNGTGKLTRLTEERYVGEFRNGKFHGKGLLKWPNGSSYEGDFVDGNREGHGKFIYHYGDEYVGSFARNKFNGSGKYTWANGDTYEGEFLNGEITGQGLVNYKELGVLGSGVWNDQSISKSLMFDLDNGTNSNLF